MTDSPFAFDFEGRVTWHDIGKGQVLTYRVVFLPGDIAERLPLGRQGAVRAEGEFDEAPFEAAWQPAGDGTYFMMVGSELLRSARKDVGDVVRVRFNVVDPHLVRVPPDLERALGMNPRALTAWEALTPGKKRGLAHTVTSAKTDETRWRRVVKIIETLLEE